MCTPRYSGLSRFLQRGRPKGEAKGGGQRGRLKGEVKGGGQKGRLKGEAKGEDQRGRPKGEVKGGGQRGRLKGEAKGGKLSHPLVYHATISQISCNYTSNSSILRSLDQRLLLSYKRHRQCGVKRNCPNFEMAEVESNHRPLNQQAGALTIRPPLPI